jgi:hypothetical protein
MKIQRLTKGEYGYPVYEKKAVIIRTAVYFIISIAVYMIGYFSTGSRENLLTIVAVLGLLPSSKSLVSVIMYMRIPKFNEEIYREIEAHRGDVDVIYSMYLTSYKLNFPINAFAVRGNNLIGYTEFEKCKTRECEQHIKDILLQNNIKNVTIKIFDNKGHFLDRLEQLRENEQASKKEKDIITLLGDISL